MSMWMSKNWWETRSRYMYIDDVGVEDVGV